MKFVCYFWLKVKSNSNIFRIKITTFRSKITTLWGFFSMISARRNFRKKFPINHKNHVLLYLKSLKNHFYLFFCTWAKNAGFACTLSLSFEAEISWTCTLVPEPKIRPRYIPSYRMQKRSLSVTSVTVPWWLVFPGDKGVLCQSLR